MNELIIAPQQKRNIEELGQAYILEGVAYDPIKVTSLHNYDEESRVYCKTCEWETTVGELPEDSGRIQPDMCPDCIKREEIGFIRSVPKGARAATS